MPSLRNLLGAKAFRVQQSDRDRRGAKRVLHSAYLRPYMFQHPNIRIAQPDEWLVNAQQLFAELHQPGRTDLPPVLPMRDPTGHWVKPQPSEVDGSMLNNFPLKFDPLWRAQICYSKTQTSVSVGLSRLRISTELEPGGISYASFAGHSLLFLNHPLAYFYDQLAMARRQLGILDEPFKAAPSRGQTGAYEAWCAREGIPAYRILREIGYSHRDLIG